MIINELYISSKRTQNSHASKALFLFLFAFCLNESIFAQINEEDLVTRSDSIYWGGEVPEKKSYFSIKPGGFIGFSSPQKYGVEARLFLGKFIEHPFHERKTFNTYDGLELSGGIYRGGYRYSIGYFSSQNFIASPGYAILISYMNNNSFARVRKGSELFGLHAEFNVVFQIRAGIYKDLNENKIIPSFGFGIPIGPNMYPK